MSISDVFIIVIIVSGVVVAFEILWFLLLDWGTKDYKFQHGGRPR